MAGKQLRQRVGNQLRHPVDALRFIIDFAQTNLVEQDDAKQWSLQFDEFVQAPLEGEALRAIMTTPPMSLATIVKLQRQALHVLRGLVDHRFVHVNVNAIYTLGKNPDSQRYELQVIGGTIVDMVLYRLLALIEAMGAVDKFRLCPEASCRRIFLKVTNKEHCSTRCHSRAYMRKYRLENSVTKVKKGRATDGKKTRPRRRFDFPEA